MCFTFLVTYVVTYADCKTKIWASVGILKRWPLTQLTDVRRHKKQSTYVGPKLLWNGVVSGIKMNWLL
jgi:hypothetical protein